MNLQDGLYQGFYNCLMTRSPKPLVLSILY